jgi:hypothetical protein
MSVKSVPNAIVDEEVSSRGVHLEAAIPPNPVLTEAVQRVVQKNQLSMPIREALQSGATVQSLSDRSFVSVLTYAPGRPDSCAFFTPEESEELLSLKTQIEDSTAIVEGRNCLDSRCASATRYLFAGGGMLLALLLAIIPFERLADEDDEDLVASIMAVIQGVLFIGGAVGGIYNLYMDWRKHAAEQALPGLERRTLSLVSQRKAHFHLCAVEMVTHRVGVHKLHGSGNLLLKLKTGQYYGGIRDDDSHKKITEKHFGESYSLELSEKLLLEEVLASDWPVAWGEIQKELKKILPLAEEQENAAVRDLFQSITEGIEAILSEVRDEIPPATIMGNFLGHLRFREFAYFHNQLEAMPPSLKQRKSPDDDEKYGVKKRAAVVVTSNGAASPSSSVASSSSPASMTDKLSAKRLTAGRPLLEVESPTSPSSSGSRVTSARARAATYNVASPTSAASGIVKKAVVPAKRAKAGKS